jgi:hypothetical protein
MKPFNKNKCLQRLNITQEQWNPDINQVPYDSHGYAIPEYRIFAINPNCPFPAAAGFHELGHIVLDHYLGPNNVQLHEMEATAVAISCLKRLEISNGLKESYQHYYNNLTEIPEDFSIRVNIATETILKAGEDS